MIQTTLDEMRRLLRQLNELEDRVLSLQDTIATFRSEVATEIGGTRDGSTQDLPAAARRMSPARQPTARSTSV
jgi:signal transduction histidine kinase